MEIILDAASTWLLESFSQRPDGPLVIRVVEGIRATAPEMTDLGGKQVGPYTRIEVTPESRCAEIRFEQALGFFTQREDFDATDPGVVRR